MLEAKTKWCPKCQQEKLRSDFKSNRSRGDSLSGWCRSCDSQYRRTDAGKAAHARFNRSEKGRAASARFKRSEKGRAAEARYAASLKGVACHLRSEHGLNGEATELARMLLAEYTRCAICGVPNYKLKSFGFWKCGGEPTNRHLTLDHIEPGCNEGGFRPLCFSCNHLRGAAILTDAEVLESMRGWYRAVTTIRSLWWMNTHVDENGVCVGGRLYRNETMEKKFARLKSEESCQTVQDVRSAEDPEGPNGLSKEPGTE